MSAESIPLPKPRESFDSVLAKNLVVARSAAGLTQHELAEAARVSRATIAQLETGYSDPRLSTIVHLANGIGISPLLLLAGALEVEALSNISQWLTDHPIDLPPDEIDRIKRLLRTGMLKDRGRAARLGAALAAAKGHDTTAEKVGAAVLSAILPGSGTVLGIALAELIGPVEGAPS